MTGGAYFTGSAQAGDQTITMQAPLETIPIFVREGGVVVEGPAVQHTGEIADGGRLETIRVFGFPGIHCLMHERDVAVSHTPERVDLSFEPGIRCEVHGARFTSEEGLLRIFSDR
jgi:alpha-glucosidase (family GH31 glycosyl hydrolase)